MKQTGQELGVYYAEIFKFLLFMQSKFVNIVCKLPQLRPPDLMAVAFEIKVQLSTVEFDL